MKRKFLGFILLAFGLIAHAQNTAVSATVVDTDGTTWTNGSWNVQFVPNPSQPNVNAYTINGTPLSPSVLNQVGAINGSGVLAVTVYQNAPITPAGSSWKITVCPNAITKCGSYGFTAVGSSMDLSSALTPVIPAPRFNPVSGAYGYNDAEAILQLKPGSTYWNVTSNKVRCYSGSAWQDCSGSSGLVTSVVPGAEVSCSPLVSGSCTGAVTVNSLAINQLTGDGTAGPGAGSQVFTLASVGSAGTVGDGTHFPIITLDTKGRVTGATAQAIPTVACGSANIPCTNTSNIFNGGTQTIQSGDYTQPAAIIRGTVSGIVTPVLLQRACAVNNATASVTAGNTIMVIGQDIAVTDSVGDTFTALTIPTDGHISYTSHTVGGSGITISSPAFFCWYEIGNVATGTTLDTYVVSARVVNQLTPLSTSITTTFNNALFLAGQNTSVFLSNQFVAGAPWTNREANGNIAELDYQQNTTTAGAYPISISTSTDTMTGVAFIVAFKPGSGLPQTGDLMQIQSQDLTVVSRFNNIGQLTNPVTAGVPANAPLTGTQEWDSTAKCLRIYDGTNWLCAGSTSISTWTTNANGSYIKYPDGTYSQVGASTLVTGTPTAQIVAITWPVAFVSAPTNITVTAITSAAGDGNPHPATCHIVRSTITTTGANAIIATPVQVGGSGYANLVAGDYCSFTAVGK